MVFTYSDSRTHYVIDSILKDSFTGTLLSDGYKAYASYVAKTERLVLAQCWTHSRRQFFNPQDSEPAAVDECLQQIKVPYDIEVQIWQRELSGSAKRRLSKLVRTLLQKSLQILI